MFTIKIRTYFEKSVSFIAAVFICTMTFAQSSGVISGLVADKSNQPIERATIVLLSLPDSVMVKGVVTDQKGFFSLNQIKDGKYVLRSSYIGFKSNAKQVLISSPKRVFSLGTIKLDDDNVMLNGITVVGNAAEMVIKNDTVEYNPEAFKTQENAVVEDLLKKLPGVEVSADGKITAGRKTS